jgi:hypothetical protein
MIDRIKIFVTDNYIERYNIHHTGNLFHVISFLIKTNSFQVEFPENIKEK